MPIKINADSYPEVTEIWGYSSNSIVLNMADGREVKIIAAHNIKSGATPKYFAHYEERIEIEVNNQRHRIWAEVHYPWQDGDTIEECLKHAIRWVIHPH